MAVLERSESKRIWHGELSDFELEIFSSQSGVWLRASNGSGGAVHRLAYPYSFDFDVRVKKQSRTSVDLTVRQSICSIAVRVEILDTELLLLRCTSRITLSEPAALPPTPRDFYPIGPEEGAKISGEIVVSQQGLNSGQLFLEMNTGLSVFYFQNFSSLQPYFVATGTSPESSVGGVWPELGLRLPTNESQPLDQKIGYCISDAFIGIRRTDSKSVRGRAALYCEFLGQIYPQLDHPETSPYDWLTRASKTLKSFKSSKAIRRDYGSLYLRPYVDAEYPDCMVQLSVIAALEGFGHWQGKPVPLSQELTKGVRRFFDPDLKTLRRYLPNVGKDKNANEVDSWYLYHPLKNLAHLAKAGHEWARELFFDSLEFGIAAAHHFEYIWPVKYDVRSFKTILKGRNPGDPGQSDVGGIYAYVMLQAHELSGDPRYLDEAKAALNALSRFEFNLLYQSNLSGFGAAACAWLAELENKKQWIDQCIVFLANIFHNSALWHSEMQLAKHYETFFAVCCLHDGPYIAAYECFDVYSALKETAERLQDKMPEHVKLLTCEMAKYSLMHSRFFFPDELPANALSDEVRNGVLDRSLSFPLEDIYCDGKPAGQVGQEVYGGGAPFVICMHSYLKFKNGKGILSIEYPYTITSETDSHVRVKIHGPKSMTCRVVFQRTKKGQRMPKIVGAEVVKGDEATVAGGSVLDISF